MSLVPISLTQQLYPNLGLQRGLFFDQESPVYGFLISTISFCVEVSDHVL
jgi:hypothetical protein